MLNDLYLHNLYYSNTIEIVNKKKGGSAFFLYERKSTLRNSGRLVMVIYCVSGLSLE